MTMIIWLIIICITCFLMLCFEINWIELNWIVAEPLWTWLQSAHNLSFLLADHYRKVVKEMFTGSETAKKLSEAGQFEVLTVWRSTI